MTIEQIQHLLNYLGYDTGGCEGICGPKTKDALGRFQKAFGLPITGEVNADTEKALKHAVAYGMPEREEGEESLETGTCWDNISNFRKSEFACKCGQYCDGFPVEPEEKLVRLLQQVREHFGVPVTVSSGIRCTRHNANVGGVSNSRHLTGKAADFCVRGRTAAAVLAYVQTLAGVRYAYAIDGSYVHLDVA